MSDLNNNFLWNYTVDVYSAIKSGLNIDSDDFAILEVIRRLYENADRYNLRHGIDKDYIAIPLKMLLGQLPKHFFKFASKSGISKRVKKLVSEGILVVHPETINGMVKYYKFGDANADLRFFENERKGTGAFKKNQKEPLKEKKSSAEKKEIQKRQLDYDIDLVLNHFAEKTKKNIYTKGKRAHTNRDAVAKILKMPENPTVEEIKDVISLKYYEWNWNPLMRNNIKISTILRPSNFRKYLDEIANLKENQNEYEAFMKNIEYQKMKLKNPSGVSQRQTRQEQLVRSAKEEAQAIIDNW